jgi:hypothetical protein
MSVGTPRSARTVRQVVLAALVLVALLVAALAHEHRARADGPVSADRCTACMLHNVSVHAPAIVLPARPPACPEVQLAPPVVPSLPSLRTLDLAPKTSPPVAARS